MQLRKNLAMQSYSSFGHILHICDFSPLSSQMYESYNPRIYFWQRLTILEPDIAELQFFTRVYPIHLFYTSVKLNQSSPEIKIDIA